MKILAIAASVVAAGTHFCGAIDREQAAAPDSPKETATKLIARLEALEKNDSQGRKIKRIYRNGDGTIRMLRFRDMELTDREFHSINQFRHLVSIDFSQSNLRDRHLVHYSDLPELVNLRTHLTKLTDASLRHLIHYPKLRSICMGKTDITYDGWTKFKSLHQAKFKTERQVIGSPSRPRKK